MKMYKQYFYLGFSLWLINTFIFQYYYIIDVYNYNISLFRCIFSYIFSFKKQINTVVGDTFENIIVFSSCNFYIFFNQIFRTVYFFTTLLLLRIELDTLFYI